MEIRKSTLLLACAGFLALTLLSGCGKSSTTGIPSVVTVFYQHAVFKNHSSIMTVGYNGYGQLGDGTLVTRSIATVVPGLGKMDGCAAGGNHSLAYSNNSSVMAWGYNNHGQLGNAAVLGAATTSTADYSAVPVRVGSLTHVVSVAAGASHSLAVADGRVWSWGYNGFGQLGVGTVNSIALGDASTPVEVLDPDKGISFSNAVQVAAGANHSLALTKATVGTTTTTTVWAWGDNTYGQLGPNGQAVPQTTPYIRVQVPFAGLADGVTVVQIAAAGSYSLALMSDGTVWAWGYNGFDQLGAASTDPLFITSLGLPASSTPHQVKVIDPVTGDAMFVDRIAAGLMHVLAMAHDSNPLLVNPTETVWGWGFNERGQLGNNPAIGGVSDPDAFVPVQALQGGTTVIGSGSPITDVLEIYAFGNSSLAKIQHAGGIPQLLGWGENSFGQLGFPITTTGLGYLAVPVAVAGF